MGAFLAHSIVVDAIKESQLKAISLEHRLPLSFGVDIGVGLTTLHHNHLRTDHSPVGGSNDRVLSSLGINLEKLNVSFWSMLSENCWQGG